MNERNKTDEYQDRLYGCARLFTSLVNSLDSALPLSYVLAFVTVAREEGLGPSEYAKKIGVTQPQMSRWLIELSVKGRGNLRKSGLGLLERKLNPNDLRQQRYYITSRGQSVLREMLINIAPKEQRTESF